MKPLEEGSRWSGGDKVFVVINEVDADDGHKWIYYREATSKQPREYSCYKESFLQRFTLLPK